MKRNMLHRLVAMAAAGTMLMSVAGSARKVAHFGSWPSMER